MNDFLEVPIRIGKLGNAVCNAIKFGNQLEVLFLTLSKTDSRINRNRLQLYSASLSHLQTSSQTCCDFVKDVCNRRKSMHCCRRPARMHEHEAGPGFRHRIGDIKIKTKRRDVVNNVCTCFQSGPGDFRLGCIDRDRNVVKLLTQPSITGTTRSISSSAGTGSPLPGRVDSPPTSIMSAPSLIICVACSRAWSNEKKRPPSLKLSGVTLRMPITSVRSPIGRCLRSLDSPEPSACSR